jgi:hypothetical protein
MRQRWHEPMITRAGVALLILATPLAAYANVTCSGIPERVYAGAHGPNDAGSKFWVVFAGWQQYLLATTLTTWQKHDSR